MLTPPTFIVCEDMKCIVVADQEKFELKNYENYDFLKGLNDVKRFYDFRRKVGGINDITFSEDIQLLAISKNMVEIDVKTGSESKGMYGDELSSFVFTNMSADRFKITSNVRTNKHLEKMLNDELKAVESVKYCYEKGVNIYAITRAFSGSVFGENKCLVPTKWSITAVDDVLSKHFWNKIKEYKPLNHYYLYVNKSYHNTFYVILMPEFWVYELVEFVGKKIFKDFEILKLRSDYAKNTTGGYYASRFAILEHLHNIGRCGGAVVLRKVSKEYYKSVGVWMIREAIRDGFSKKPLKFNTLKELKQTLNFLDESSISVHSNFLSILKIK